MKTFIALYYKMVVDKASLPRIPLGKFLDYNDQKNYEIEIGRFDSPLARRTFRFGK